MINRLELSAFFVFVVAVLIAYVIDALLFNGSIVQAITNTF